MDSIEYKRGFYILTSERNWCEYWDLTLVQYWELNSLYVSFNLTHLICYIISGVPYITYSLRWIKSPIMCTCVLKKIYYFEIPLFYNGGNFDLENVKKLVFRTIKKTCKNQEKNFLHNKLYFTDYMIYWSVIIFIIKLLWFINSLITKYS